MKNLILISAIVMGSMNAFKPETKDVVIDGCFTPNTQTTPSTLEKSAELYRQWAEHMCTPKRTPCGQAQVQKIIREKQTEKITAALVAFLNDLTSRINEEMDI